jgi:DNA repair exonuclease SbcCD ATPase subunit
MLDEDLKTLLASAFALQKENSEQIKALVASQARTDEQLQRTNQHLQRTDEQLQRTNQHLQQTGEQLQRTNQQLQRTDEQLQRTEEQLQTTDTQLQRTDLQLSTVDQQIAELRKSLQETDQMLKAQAKEADRRIKELGKQIGGLGEKFGSFTEGLALPSMQKILRKRFKMEVVSPSVRVLKQGQHLEIDVLAYANSDINEAYVVEVKSHAREESIAQLRSILERFRWFFPEHRNKKLYGVLAVVDAPTSVKARILESGFYSARIHDGVFDFDVPANFKPTAY